MIRRAVLVVLLVAASVLIPFGAAGAADDDANCYDDVTNEYVCVVDEDANCYEDVTNAYLCVVDNDANCLEDVTGAPIDGCTVYVPPVETPVEQQPSETYDDEDEAIVPPPVVVVTPTPTPTPTPTATAAPAPAGWEAPLYTDQFGGTSNSIAILALGASVLLAGSIGALIFVRRAIAVSRRERPAVRSVGVLSPDEATKGVLPAGTATEFTDYDRAMLGYTLPDKTTL